jgi:hypothetical protein
MRTIETTLYSFEELTDEAQEKAIQDYRDTYDSFDPFESDCIVYEAKEIGKLIGIEIDKIYYSGFWSQGDGACFVGTYQYKKGGLKALKQYAPNDEELHRIGKELQEVQRRYFYTICATVTHKGRYHHERSNDIDVVHHLSEYGNPVHVNDTDEEEVSEALRDYMRWIYKQLETQYEYCTSDEAIREELENNGYEYTEEGARV